jgi:hypothetical protein
MDNNKVKIDERFEALKSDLNIYQEFWAFSPNQSIEKALHHVVTELINFLDQRRIEIDQFVAQASEDQPFLTELFETDPDQPLDEPTLNARLGYFRNFLLWTYLQKAIQDSHDIRRIAQQRDFYRGRGQNNILQTLQQADQLALEYLKQAMENGLVDIQQQSITPICYFDKTTSINRAPYTQLPLISLPITAINSATDLFAVAHETGHFIYHHLDPVIAEQIDNFAGLENPDSKYNQPYRPGEAYQGLKTSAWVEEIFADVFASMVGGPDYDRQFRDFLLLGVALTQEAFEEDDGDHPPIMIRPYALQNPDSDLLWTDILAQLGVNRASLNTAETQLREIAGFMRDTLGVMAKEEGYSELDQVDPYKEDYPYQPQDLTKRPPRRPIQPGLRGELDKFERELEAWRKAEWPLICPGC